jgi:hypothetical protein
MKFFGRLFLGLALAACVGFAGCGGSEAAPKKETPATPETGGGKTGMNDSGSGSEMVLVSLKLPNMT